MLQGVSNNFELIQGVTSCLELLCQDDGAIEDVDPDKYSPRRLHDSLSASAAVGWMATPSWRLLLAGAYDGSAVPDYAISASNLDFDSAGGSIATSHTLGNGLVAGLTVSKFFPLTRVIDGSAWGVADADDDDYVDNRFSPDGPYRTSADGSYAASQSSVGVRLGGTW